MRALLAAPLLLLALATPARAATVSLEPRMYADPDGDGCSKYMMCDYQVVSVRDTAGERNDVRVTQEGGNLVVRDSAAAPKAGSGCTSAGDDAVSCPTNQLEVLLGGGDDTATVELSARVDGGAGDDVLGLKGQGTLLGDGGPGDDTLTGGAGSDTLNGGGGRDTLHGNKGADSLDDDDRSGSADADVIDGGPGADRLFSYIARSAGVRVDLAAHTGGEHGEADRLQSIEVVNGGRGDDVLLGSPRREVLLGRAGDDTIDARAGRDELWGGDGDDRLVSRDHSRDLVEGGLGRDRAWTDRLDRVRHVERRF